jgi:hypothetical protein
MGQATKPSSPLVGASVLPPVVSRLIWTVLGGVFLFAGIAKGMYLAVDSGGSSLEFWGSFIWMQFELAVGVLLVFNFIPKPLWGVLLGCLAMFVGITLPQAMAGHADCGCFGIFSVDPRLVLILDFAALIGIYFAGPTAPMSLTIARPALVSGTWAVVALLVAVVVLFPSAIPWRQVSDSAASEPAAWRGTELPLLHYLDDVGDLVEGAWVVVLYHPDCRSCDTVLRRLRARIADGRHHFRVALVDVSSRMGPISASAMAGRWADHYTRLSPEWTGRITTPVLLAIADREVLEVGDLGRVLRSWDAPLTGPP